MEDDHHSTAIQHLLDYDITFHHWSRPKEIKAVVGLIHGLADQSSRYGHVAAWFKEEDIAFEAFDLPGHGLSSGKRGHINDYDTFLQLIDQFKAQLKLDYPGIPIFLYGHSMGGNLLLNYVLRYEPNITGAIISAPAIKTFADVPRWVRGIVRKIAEFVPAMNLPLRLKTRWLSRDEEIVRQADADPHRFKSASIKLGVGILDAAEFLYTKRHESAVPILLMHGSGDHINYLKGSQYFATNFEGDLTLKIWDGLYHELHNEPEKEMVLKEVVQWIYNILDPDTYAPLSSDT